MEKVTVIGAGSWGTTLASIAAQSVHTVLWARRDELASSINDTGQNPDYLHGYELPTTLSATSDLEAAAADADVIIMAVPSHGFRDVFKILADELDNETPIVSLTKGIEETTLATMTQVVGEEAPGHLESVTGVLTGPNLAGEIVAGQPTAAVIAMAHEPTAEMIQDVLMGPAFRVYTNDDVIGCELAGAMKNVMAIAAGMSDGLGFGDNTRAALLTRALAELTRLGTRLGGQPSTFAGLAGMGDLIATCSSTQSRNHRVGAGLALGKTLEELFAEMNMVAEGVKTTRGVLGLAEQAGVEMPITEHVAEVLYDGMAPRDAVLSLMTREAKGEHDD